MPKLQGLLLTPDTNTPPLEIGLKVSKNNVTDVIQQLLGGSNLNTSNCDLGVLYSVSDDVDKTRNVLATQIRTKFSRKMPQALTVTNGRCFLVGEGEKETLVSVDKDSVSTVMKLYEQLTGHAISGRKKHVRVGPPRAKREYDYFAKVFQKSRRAELSAQNIVPVFADIAKEAREAWKNMSNEDKAPYLAQAAEDKVRFEREKAEFVKKNPPRPKNPRNAYNMYCRAFPDKETRVDWKSLTTEQKASYENLAKEDKVRYEEELKVFASHCEETGKDFNALVSRKKRKKTEEKEDEDQLHPKKKKRRATSEAETPKKKRRTATGATSEAEAPEKKKKGKKAKEPEPEEAEEESESSSSSEDEESEEEEQ